jgi:TonB family protein
VDRSSEPIASADYSHLRVDYPDDAIDSLAHGLVVMKLSVDATGKVTRVEVLKKLGFGLDETATKLAMAFRFHPALDADGHPVAGEIGWRMSFAEYHWLGESTDHVGRNGGGGGMRTGTSSEGPDGPISLNPPHAPAPSRSQSPTPSPTPIITASSSVALIPPKQREQICHLTLKAQGGPSSMHRCLGWEDPSHIDTDNFDVESSQPPPLPSAMADARKPIRTPTHVITLETEAQCVDKIVRAGRCNVTVGELQACFVATMKDPCDGPRSAACRPLVACH